MFRRRREEPAASPPEREPPPPPATMARPARAATGMAGMGLRAAPSAARGTPARDPRAARVRASRGDVGRGRGGAHRRRRRSRDDARDRRRRARGARRGWRALGCGHPGGARRGGQGPAGERRAPGASSSGPPPAIILFVGVNGTGKTTTIGKLAARLRAEGHSLALAAGRHVPRRGHRAAPHLGRAGRRAGHRATRRRRSRRGGLRRGGGGRVTQPRRRPRRHRRPAPEQGPAHGRADQDRTVIERRLPGQPRHVLLVLDATTGQNGLLQAEAFSREAGVTGIVLTKLDGVGQGRRRGRGRGSAGRADPVRGHRRGDRRARAVRPGGLCGVAVRRVSRALEWATV